MKKSEQIRQRAHVFLSGYLEAVISTVNQYNHPQAAMVYYIADDDFNLYFLTRQSSRKYANLQHNPAVAVVVADPINQISIQLEGKAKDISDQKQTPPFAERLLSLLNDKHFHTAPLFQIDSGAARVIRVTPEWLRYSSFKDFKEDGL